MPNHHAFEVTLTTESWAELLGFGLVLVFCTTSVWICLQFTMRMRKITKVKKDEEILKKTEEKILSNSANGEGTRGRNFQSPN